jgi:hypothetical protein
MSGRHVSTVLTPRTLFKEAIAAAAEFPNAASRYLGEGKTWTAEEQAAWEAIHDAEDLLGAEA